MSNLSARNAEELIAKTLLNSDDEDFESMEITLAQYVGLLRSAPIYEKKRQRKLGVNAHTRRISYFRLIANQILGIKNKFNCLFNP